MSSLAQTFQTAKLSPRKKKSTSALRKSPPRDRHSQLRKSGSHLVPRTAKYDENALNRRPSTPTQFDMSPFPSPRNSGSISAKVGIPASSRRRSPPPLPHHLVDSDSDFASRSSSEISSSTDSTFVELEDEFFAELPGARVIMPIVSATSTLGNSFIIDYLFLILFIQFFSLFKPQLFHHSNPFFYLF